jgi:hypothetical protein
VSAGECQLQKKLHAQFEMQWAIIQIVFCDLCTIPVPPLQSLKKSVGFSIHNAGTVAELCTYLL